MTNNIEWCEKTWNPIVGCSKVSDGCSNCYALAMANRLQCIGSTKWLYRGLLHSRMKPTWTGEIHLNEKALMAPLKLRKSTVWFVNSMGDPFHKNCPREWIYKMFAAMALTYDVDQVDINKIKKPATTKHRQRHIYQLLTKRPMSMQRFISELLAVAGSDDMDLKYNHPFSKACRDIAILAPGDIWIKPITLPWKWLTDGMPGLWLGTSIEDQKSANERIPYLRDIPADVRFISAEPLLGRVNLNLSRWATDADKFDGDGPLDIIINDHKIDWVICGGETHRPMHPSWAISLRYQCQAAGVPFLFKKWGRWYPGMDKAGKSIMVCECGWHSDSAEELQKHVVGELACKAVGVRVMHKTPKLTATDDRARRLEGELHDGYPKQMEGF